MSRTMFLAASLALACLAGCRNEGSATKNAEGVPASYYDTSAHPDAWSGGARKITITKTAGEWQEIKPAVLGAIMEHYLSNEPLLAGDAGATAADDEFFDEKDADTVATIKDLIETRVRPAVANDGGDITFKGFKDGIVFLTMKGSCSGCPSSTATLKHGIQNLLKHFVPDVTEVRPV